MITKTKIALALVLIFILSLAGCGIEQQGAGVEQQSLRMAQRAPAFKLEAIGGQTLSLDSLKGKIVLVNFWATTCPSCVAEMPYFESLQKEWQNRSDVKILMINLGQSESQVSRFLVGRNFTFTVLLDQAYVTGVDYAVRYTPTTVIIDQDGVLRESIVGPFKDAAAIKKKVTPYLPK